MRSIELLADIVPTLNASLINAEACNELRQAVAVLLAGRALADKKQALIYLMAMAHQSEHVRELAVDVLRHDRAIRFGGVEAP